MSDKHKLQKAKPLERFRDTTGMPLLNDVNNATDALREEEATLVKEIAALKKRIKALEGQPGKAYSLHQNKEWLDEMEKKVACF